MALIDIGGTIYQLAFIPKADLETGLHISLGVAETFPGSPLSRPIDALLVLGTLELQVTKT